MKDLTDAGARKEQIQGAFQLVQQAEAAATIAKKTYDRMQNLYNDGVISGQKRDEAFAAYKEAQKYVGTPYVWGGSTPETGFDCSGYVCWVYNQNGYDVGRTTANGLWNKCQKISEAEAKPGDLVFFKGTYDTPGMSHTGIYLGNGMMVSAGDPIKYANIHSSYWQQYLAGFGRLSK